MDFTKFDYHYVLIVFVTSLSSWIVSFALSYLGIMTDQVAVFTAGVICLTVVALGIYVVFRNFNYVDPLMYTAGVFSWTCLIDLGIALELDGYISNFIGYYFAEGEPYLKTAHGTLINYWDGTFHFALYLTMILFFTNRKSYREIGLYWAGSILNSMVVLLPGALIGEHPFKLSIFLNTPYLILPIVESFRLLNQHPPQARNFLQYPSLLRRPVDMAFLLFFAVAAALVAFRGLAALGGNSEWMQFYVKEFEPYIQDKTKFPLVQVLAYSYFFLAYYLFAMYGLLYPGQHWMADWSLIHAGAAAQAQATYMLGAWHARTPSSLHSSYPSAFWALHVALLVVPQLFAYYCCSDEEKFGRTNTVYKSKARKAL